MFNCVITTVVEQWFVTKSSLANVLNCSLLFLKMTSESAITGVHRLGFAKNI